ncbi:MAG: ribonuclease HII [bacterium]|nr:ribonuclease HII [bacterium]
MDPSVLHALREDGRAGARELAARHEARSERQARELQRLGVLFAEEAEQHALGIARVAGIDEVGMGPLAGPVVSAAVVLPENAQLFGLNDSKKLSRAARERLDGEIRSLALGVSIGLAEPREIDEVNIYQAGLLAMRRALEGLAPAADFALVDARRIPGVSIPQKPIVRGDTRIACICAASIVAKVWRDAHMSELDRRFPDYGFAHNSGYGTAEHLSALTRHGPTPSHRHSFEPVRLAARPGRS